MAPPQAKDEVRHSASPDIESLVYDDEHEVCMRYVYRQSAEVFSSEYSSEWKSWLVRCCSSVNSISPHISHRVSNRTDSSAGC